ncbi:MAG: nicotinamide riboside transporter PnuC [Bacteroidales bacterium]|nr:nicotinamide riboside transporter PnuC [Bacteroidales bacterium]
MFFQFESSLFQSILSWIVSNQIEIFAALTGGIYLMYSVLENKLLWVFGAISSALYIYIYHHAKIYADMGLYVYYVLVSIYGWFHWLYGSNANSKQLPIVKLKTKQWLIVFMVIAALLSLVYFILNTFTDSDIAFWDALTTSSSIVATWMLARKILGHWLIWIVVDIISMILYVYKGLYPTVVLFLLYTVFAVIGYIKWKKNLQVQA